jgi:hypothetical protein
MTVGVRMPMVMSGEVRMRVNHEVMLYYNIMDVHLVPRSGPSRKIVRDGRGRLTGHASDPAFAMSLASRRFATAG